RGSKVRSAGRFRQARKPAYSPQVEWGPEIGIRKSSAQFTAPDSPQELLGLLVVGVVDLRQKQVGAFVAECLAMSFHDEASNVALFVPDKAVPPGTRRL